MEKQAKHDSLLAHDERKLYRGDDKVFAGVCSGIAERLDADAILVRVTLVVLACCTFGLAVIPYVALAAFLPSRDEASAPVEVNVDEASVRSDRYQRVVRAGQRPVAQQRAYGVRADAGHIPPAPPTGEAAPNRNACTYSMGVIEFDQERVARRLPIVVALVVLITALFVLFVNYGVAFIPGVSVVGFWPVLFVVVGTTLLVCFADKLSLRARLCGLIACIEACLAVLPFSLGICPLQSLGRIGDATAVLWLVVAACVAIGLIFDRFDFFALGIGLAALALTVSYFDMGIIDRIATFSAYAHHNMTLPLFRGQ